MDRIYNDAKDKNVATVVVYAANTGSKIYYDKDHKVEVPAADCLDLFMKGVVALKGTTYYAAKTCTAAGVIDFGLSA